MPRKGRLNITAQLQNGRAEVRIDGDITMWEDTAGTFRMQLQGLLAQGVRDAHVYLNTRGGNVFSANEIVNEVKRFPGRVTGEGGAMVASAGTYIMLHLLDFSMASNGMVMIHKPKGVFEGNEDEVLSEVEGLKKVTQNYRALYAKAMGKTEAEVEAMWKDGDVWLTAQEAKDLGLVKRITDEALITEEDVQDIAACGAPKDKLPKAAAAAPTTTTMDIKALRAALGMPENATEQEVLAKAKEMKELNERHIQAAADLRKAEVKTLIDAAIKDRKITEDYRASFEAKFAANHEAAKKELEALKPLLTMSAVVDAGKAEGATAAAAKGREGWKYDEWASKDLKGLQAMMKSDPERFAALYEERYGSKPDLTQVK